jgi:omega-6 fatty acid desaturase (delta-12 desaturase)
LPAFDPSKEDLLGARVSNEIKREMWEALGDSPISAALGSASYLVSLSSSIKLSKHSFCVFTARRLACIYHHKRLWSKEISKGYHSSVYRKFVQVQVEYLKHILDFNPDAPMFSPHHYGQVIMSNVGVFLWICSIAVSIYYRGFLDVFRVYLVPYLW